MEEFVKRSLLYDFYGDLLTEHQKEIYGAYVLDNLSYAEIAQEFDISRQGVHDLIRRVEGILEEYEAKLQLVAKFLEVKQKVREIEDCQSLSAAKQAAEKILELL